jgi:hypothetical protein
VVSVAWAPLPRISERTFSFVLFALLTAGVLVKCIYYSSHIDSSPITTPTSGYRNYHQFPLAGISHRMGTALAGWLALAVLLVIPEATESARSYARALALLPESNVYGDAGANTTCLGYATQVNTTGPTYLSSAAEPLHSSFLKINSACQSSNFGEFYNWTALSFDFYGTQSNANCPMTISMSRCCNSACATSTAYTSAVINITDLAPLGTIPSTWQTLTVSMAKLQNNSALNCNNTTWNLGRLNYDLQLNFCTSCNPGPQNVCNIRRVKVLQAMPNLAPRVLLKPAPVYVGPASVFYLNGTVTDDGLPLSKVVTGRWTVTSAPVVRPAPPYLSPNFPTTSLIVHNPHPFAVLSAELSCRCRW